MERYSAYKDSGINWIGEIPEGWDTAKVGQLFSSRRETVSDSDYAPLSVTKNGIVPQLKEVVVGGFLSYLTIWYSTGRQLFHVHFGKTHQKTVRTRIAMNNIACQSH